MHLPEKYQWAPKFLVRTSNKGHMTRTETKFKKSKKVVDKRRVRKEHKCVKNEKINRKTFVNFSERVS